MAFDLVTDNFLQAVGARVTGMNHSSVCVPISRAYCSSRLLEVCTHHKDGSILARRYSKYTYEYIHNFPQECVACFGGFVSGVRMLEHLS